MVAATGDIEEGTPSDEGKDPVAVSGEETWRRGSAKSLTPERRAGIAKAAAAERWKPQA